MSNANLILANWADDPSDLNTLLVAADAFREESLYDEEMTCRWMHLFDRFPGRRVEVKRQPYIWLYDLRLLRNDYQSKRMRKLFPNAVLPRQLEWDFSPKMLSFQTPQQAFQYLCSVLESHRKLLGAAAGSINPADKSA